MNSKIRTALLVLVSCLLTAFTLIASAQAKPIDQPVNQSGKQKEYAEGTVVVKFKSIGNDPGVQNALGRSYGFSVRNELYGSHGIKRLDVPVGKEEILAKALSHNPLVEFAEPDYVSDFYAIPSDPSYVNQWGLPKINAPTAWDITTGSSNVVIAIVDSGVDITHPDLSPKLLPGYNTINPGSLPEDIEGHGSHVAGIAAAATNNAQGIAGVSWGAKILPVKVDAEGSYMAEGIFWAAANGADVINISMGQSRFDNAVASAVQYAYDNGVVVVAAAGNGGNENNAINYPAALPHVIAVGATTNDDPEQVASFSTHNSSVDVSAPGAAIYSCWIGGGYENDWGTSMASPHVAGLAALMLSVNPNLTPKQVTKLLEDTAQDLPPADRDDRAGFGRIDARRAVDAATSYVWVTDTIAPVIEPGFTNDESLITIHYSDPGDSNGVDGDSSYMNVDGARVYGCSVTATTMRCPKKLELGHHDITGAIVDYSGNSTPYSLATDIFDTAEPVIQSSTPTTDQNHSFATFSATYSDPYPSSGINTALTSITVDDVPLTGCTVTQTSISCAASNIVNGSRAVTYKVVDNAGYSSSLSRNINFTYNEPDIFNVQPAGYLTGSTAIVRADYFAASGINPASVQVKIDRGIVHGCNPGASSVACQLSGLANGNHVIEVSASDYTGHSNSASGSFYLHDVTVLDLQISDSVNGGDCATVGTWDANTKTCTLNADIQVVGANNGINILSNDITLDGAGHRLFGTGTGYTTGISIQALSNVTVRNLAVDSFENGIYAVSAPFTSIHNNTIQNNINGFIIAPTSFVPDSDKVQVYQNSFINNSAQAIVGNGFFIQFSQPLPAGGNYWNNFNHPLADCSDNDGNARCDSAYNFTGGSDALAWTAANAWNGLPADTTAPEIWNLRPSGWVTQSAATLSGSFGDVGGSGTNPAGVIIQLDGNPVSGCTINSDSFTCPVTGLGEGSHQVAVSVPDNTANVGVATSSFNVDTIGVVIGAFLPSGTKTGPATVISTTYSAPSGINTATVQVKLDNVTLNSCNAQATSVSCGVAGYVNGAHSIQVSASDMLGHSNTAYGSFTAQSAGGSISITANSTGQNCPLVGTWDNTAKKCTLNTDIQVVRSGVNGININAAGVTLDGNGHRLIGFGSGYADGVTCVSFANTTINNVDVSGFRNGAYLLALSNATLTGNTLHNNSTGLTLSSTTNVTVYRNNFDSNTTQTSVSGSGMLFSQVLPIGGNWWSNFSIPAQGCNDINSDGFCDASYSFTGGIDEHPWVNRNGWLP